MEEQESSAPNFIPKDLLDIICILERDERHHSYKIVRNGTGFSLIAKFGAKNVESTPQGQLLEGVECHIYLYCFTFDDINLNRALVIIVLFPTKYSNKKVCANDIRK